MKKWSHVHGLEKSLLSDGEPIGVVDPLEGDHWVAHLKSPCVHHLTDGEIAVLLLLFCFCLRYGPPEVICLGIAELMSLEESDAKQFSKQFLKLTSNNANKLGLLEPKPAIFRHRPKVV